MYEDESAGDCARDIGDDMPLRKAHKQLMLRVVNILKISEYPAVLSHELVQQAYLLMAQRILSQRLCRDIDEHSRRRLVLFLKADIPRLVEQVQLVVVVIVRQEVSVCDLLCSFLLFC